MAKEILECTFEHEEISDSTLVVIVKEMWHHPAVRKLINPIVTEEDFKSAFKYVPEKMASLFSGCGVRHYKACDEG
jgi:hypothetical protein